jgi:hypothetical protein
VAAAQKWIEKLDEKRMVLAELITECGFEGRKIVGNQ